MSAQIKAPELLSALRRIEARGTIETAHRTKSVCSRVFHLPRHTGARFLGEGPGPTNAAHRRARGCRTASRHLDRHKVARQRWLGL
jgi:hypothetical protein